MAGRFVRASKYREPCRPPSCPPSLPPRALAGRRQRELPKHTHTPCADKSPGHVYGKPTRKEFCYDNLHISRNAWDTNLVKVQTLPEPT